MERRGRDGQFDLPNAWERAVRTVGVAKTIGTADFRRRLTRLDEEYARIDEHKCELHECHQRLVLIPVFRSGHLCIGSAPLSLEQRSIPAGTPLQRLDKQMQREECDTDQKGDDDACLLSFDE